MASQRIDGNNNVQVGGDLVVVEPFDPDNPNLIDCPSCWKPVSRAAPACPKCGFPVAAHFAAKVQAERDKAAQRNIMIAFMFFMGSGLLISLSWFPESLKGPLAMASLAGLFVAGASGNQNRRR
jgi:hypothetical protein